MAIWKSNWIAVLAAGVLVGVVVGSLLPHTPLYAVSTDRQENFAIATGYLDEDTEGVYFLDFLTGDLKASVLSPVTGKFNAGFSANILNDLGVDVAKNPKYLMVTGTIRLHRKGGNINPGEAVIYVAELTSGKVAAYAVPWSKSAHQGNVPLEADLVLLDVLQFRTAAVRRQ